MVSLPHVVTTHAFTGERKNEGECTYAMHRICEHRVHGVQKSLVQIHFVGERTEEYRRGGVRRWVAGHLQTARVESNCVDVHEGYAKRVHQSKRTLGKCPVQNDQVETTIQQILRLSIAQHGIARLKRAHFKLKLYGKIIVTSSAHLKCISYHIPNTVR